MNQNSNQKGQDFILVNGDKKVIITTEVSSDATERMSKYAEAYRMGEA